MKQRMIRILMAKIGEGGGDSILRLAKAFRDAGFEVIYTETQKPEAIVASAVQEAIDHIGVTTLPGADLAALAAIRGLLDAEGLSAIQVTAGGYVDSADAGRVKETGIAEFFPAGTSFTELIKWAKENIKSCYD